MDNDGDSAKAADPKGVAPRALALLRMLSSSETRQLSTSELARRSEIPLQSVHRIMKELADGGLVVQDQANRHWSLGPFALSLGAAAQQQFSWAGVAHESLVRITAATGETSILTVSEGAYGSYLDIVESPHPLRLVEYIGQRLPLTVGASRRVILAHLPHTERLTVLASLRADGVNVDLRQANKQALQTLAQGYAASYGEVTEHTVGVAVALTYRQRPVASLEVAGPQHRMTPESVSSATRVLTEEAQQLTAPGQAPATPLRW